MIDLQALVRVVFDVAGEPGLLGLVVWALLEVRKVNARLDSVQKEAQQAFMEAHSGIKYMNELERKINALQRKANPTNG